MFSINKTLNLKKKVLVLNTFGIDNKFKLGYAKLGIFVNFAQEGGETGGTLPKKSYIPSQDPCEGIF